MHDRRIEHLVVHLGRNIEMIGRAAHMQRRPIAIRADVENCCLCRDAIKALHCRNIDVVLGQGHQHPVGFLVVADGPDGERLQAELGRVDDRTARRTGDGQPNLINEIDIAAVGNAGYGRPSMSRMYRPMTETS